MLKVGISFTLIEFNTRLAQNKKSDGSPDPLFMPTGQCSNVHLGGHAQTGGFGQLSRAFGLLTDHIVSAEIITADGIKKTISPTSADQELKDLFFANFGGGPGNYGVVTQFTCRPLKDSDHLYSRAYKLAVPYSKGKDKDVLANLFEIGK